MPKGPAGGPRPLAKDSLNGFAVFTATLGEGSTGVNIPNWMMEERGLEVGDTLEVRIYPLFAGVFNSKVFREFKRDIASGGQVNVPRQKIRELNLTNGGPVLAAFID